MARYALIDDYLDAMRDGLSWRRDLEDLVSEMEDHLYSTVEQMCSAGQERALAERTALTRFGDPKTLASVYASTIDGGLAVPTNFTRTAGLMAQAAAALLALIATWGAFAMISYLRANGQSATEGDDWQIYWVLFTVALLAASVIMVIVVFALRQRTGARGLATIVALALSGLGAAASTLAWFQPGWAVPLGTGAFIMAYTVLRTGVGPVVPTVLYGTGFLTGTATFLVMTTLKVGRVDGWGDYPAAFSGGVAVACGLTAIGLFGIGRWLRNEEPADIDSTPIAA